MKLAIPLLLTLAACTAGPRLHLTGGQVSLAGPLAADDDGNVFAVAPSNLVRYDLDDHEVEELLFENVRLAGVAAVPDGPLLVLAGNRIEAVAAGKRIPIVDLPGDGLLLAARGDAAYVGVAVGGHVDVLRYRFAEKALDPIFRSDVRPHALAAVTGGCLVAVGTGVHKVFDPHRGEVHRRLLFATSAQRITGLAADEASQTVFLSDGGATHFWKDGRIWPLAPLGGSLAVSAGRVVIADPRSGQVMSVAVPSPPAVNEALEPVPAPVTYTHDVRLTDRSPIWQPDGSMALMFTVANDSPSWIDQVEVRFGFIAPDESVLFEVVVALAAVVASGGGVLERRVDVPASMFQSRAIRREAVKVVRFTALRARQSSLYPHLRIKCADLQHHTAKFELRNLHSEPVRFSAIEIGYLDDRGKYLDQPIHEPVDVLLEPGESRVVEVPVRSTMEGPYRHMHSWHGRARVISR